MSNLNRRIHSLSQSSTLSATGEYIELEYLYDCIDIDMLKQLNTYLMSGFNLIQTGNDRPDEILSGSVIMANYYEVNSIVIDNNS